MTSIVGPQQAIVVTARAEIEEFGKNIQKEAADVLYWHTPISHDEQLFVIAVNKNKSIVPLIQKSHIFVVNFVNITMVESISTISQKHDVLRRLPKEIQFVEASHCDAPRLFDACAWLECSVIEQKEYHDTVVFIAKIINSSHEYDCKRIFHVQGKHFTTTND